MGDGVWILKYWDHWHRVPIKMNILSDMSKAGRVTSTAFGLGVRAWQGVVGI